MSFTITIQPSGQTFQAEGSQTIMEAARQQGIILPYRCRKGTCGACKGSVLNGKIDQAAHSSSALSNEETMRGSALFCCATARSDLEIKIREVMHASDIPIRKLPCHVIALERTTSDVMIVKLQLPANVHLQYFAGQYIDIVLKDGKRRSYSIATPPHHEGPIELHIRHMPGGTFTDYVFSTMTTREILYFEGPLGTFFLRENSNKPMILLASGTGFAPIKSIVEHSIAKNIRRPITFYWGARCQKDLYLFELAKQWADTLPYFSFIPVLSEASEEEWQGRTGLVHRAVIDDLPNLAAYQVYACGAPVMVKAALHDFTVHHQLPPQEFYADAFTSAADLANSDSVAT